MDYKLSNDLSHHGIKGQKWGVRRFQNKDGSLTKAGGKRYNGSDYKPRKNVIKEVGDKVKTYKKKQNLKKARKIAAEKKAAAEQRKKDVEAGRLSAKQMTTEEINARMERLNLEKRYKQLLNETDPPTKAVTEGKSFVKKIWNDGVQPAVADATKQVLKDVLIKNASKRLGLNDDASDALSKMAKEWQNKQTISNAKKTIYDNERHMRGESDDKLPNMDERIKIYQNPNKLTKEEKDRYQRQGWYRYKEPDGEKIVDEYFSNGYGQDTVRSTPNGAYARRGEEIVDRYLRNGNLRYPPAVIQR